VIDDTLTSVCVVAPQFASAGENAIRSLLEILAAPMTVTWISNMVCDGETDFHMKILAERLTRCLSRSSSETISRKLPRADAPWSKTSTGSGGCDRYPGRFYQTYKIKTI
jgi:hypothetical protein